MVEIIKEDLRLINGGDGGSSYGLFTNYINAINFKIYLDFKEDVQYLMGQTVGGIMNNAHNRVHIDFLSYFGQFDKDGILVGFEEYDIETIIRFCKGVQVAMYNW